MKLMAKTNEKSFLNNYSGEKWQEVTECKRYFPSGLRSCVRFPDGFICKIERCEVCYVF